MGSLVDVSMKVCNKIKAMMAGSNARVTWCAAVLYTLLAAKVLSSKLTLAVMSQTTVNT